MTLCRFWQTDCYDYGIRSSARVLVEERLAGSSGRLPDGFFGLGLKRWLPLHFAMGIAGFARWFVVGLIYARRSPPKYGIPVWLAALITGIATGLCIGLLSYYFPW